MAFGKWISSMKGLFSEGPMKDLSEEMAEVPQVKLAAENVAYTNEFRETFNVNSPVKDNIRNSFLFSMLVMASHIVIADGKVEPEEYQFLGKFLRENFGEEAEDARQFRQSSENWAILQAKRSPADLKTCADGSLRRIWNSLDARQH